MFADAGLKPPTTWHELTAPVPCTSGVLGVTGTTPTRPSEATFRLDYSVVVDPSGRADMSTLRLTGNEVSASVPARRYDLVAEVLLAAASGCASAWRRSRRG